MSGLETTKDVLQIIAWISAGGFFGYKALSGYLTVDMKVRLSCERKPSVGGKDYLAVTAVIIKGERGGVELHDAQVRLQSQMTRRVHGPVDLKTIERLGRTPLQPDPPGSQSLRSRIDWTRVPADVPRLKLPPGDEMQLAALFEVEANEPYLVETVILARRIFLGHLKRRFGQWRSTIVSLPCQ
jgi:hypothetical protein